MCEIILVTLVFVSFLAEVSEKSHTHFALPKFLTYKIYEYNKTIVFMPPTFGWFVMQHRK